MAEPTDTKLYNETKMEVDKSYDKPSAYRSMAYSRFYMRAFREKYGDAKKPYKGKKPGDLEKWRRDKWIDVRSYLDVPNDPKQCGTIDYGKKEYPLCMPLSKVKKYSREDLASFVNQKSKLGKSRLVKESFLNLVNEKPLETKDVSSIKAENIKVLKAPEKKIKAVKIKEEPSGKVGRPVTVNIEAQRAERKEASDKRYELNAEIRNQQIEGRKLFELAKERKRDELIKRNKELKDAKVMDMKLARQENRLRAQEEKIKERFEARQKRIAEKQSTGAMNNATSNEGYEKPKRAVKEKFTLPREAFVELPQATFKDDMGRSGTYLQSFD
jgi:hypothetical protein